jgi:hypothetical protein
MRMVPGGPGGELIIRGSNNAGLLGGRKTAGHIRMRCIRAAEFFIQAIISVRMSGALYFLGRKMT